MFASLTLKGKNDMVFKKSYRRNVFPVLFFEKGMLPFPTTLPSPPCPERFGDSYSPPLRNLSSLPSVRRPCLAPGPAPRAAPCSGLGMKPLLWRTVPNPTAAHPTAVPVPSFKFPSSINLLFYFTAFV